MTSGFKCKCCGKEISLAQARFSGLCPTCDMGKCQRPSEYHKLEKRIDDLLKIIANLKTLNASHSTSANAEGN